MITCSEGEFFMDLIQDGVILTLLKDMFALGRGPRRRTLTPARLPCLVRMLPFQGFFVSSYTSLRFIAFFGECVSQGAIRFGSVMKS